MADLEQLRTSDSRDGLSYFGKKVGQKEIGTYLRPDPDDKNVNLEEMAAYAQRQGLSATIRAQGDAERLRRLITAGVPVLIETWHESKPNDGMGHYRLLIGFDDTAGQWIAYDSFDARDLVKGEPYTGIRLPYEETDRLWTVFNRQYLVIYDAARSAAVEGLLNKDRDPAAMSARVLAQAQAIVQAQPNDPFAWFNLGSDLVALGQIQGGRPGLQPQRDASGFPGGCSGISLARFGHTPRRAAG